LGVSHGSNWPETPEVSLLAKDSGSNLFHLLLCPFCPFFGELTQVVCGPNVIIYGFVVFVVAVLFATAAGGAAPLEIIRDTVRPR